MSRRQRLTAILQWAVLGVLAGVMAGTASALFLWLLARATGFREQHVGLVFALPLAGLVMGLLLARVGPGTLAGNNLVIDTIHDNGPKLPLRMAPVVLLGSVWTHLFGGSAGREGTAVQMGASLTDGLSHLLGLDKAVRRQMLAAGVAGGFGSVFGTPIAGTIFGLEFVVLGRIEYDALLPALMASLVGDRVTRALGIVHMQYPTVPFEPLTPLLMAKWLAFALAVAGIAVLFIDATHFVKRRLAGLRLPVRMLFGGAAVTALWLLVGTDRYLGLGLPSIAAAFDGSMPVSVSLWKVVFTAVTLGSGFLGGEVTPLFFVGATLGSAVAPWLGLPLHLAVAVGLAGVFATASNTPLALSVMAVELFGVHVLPHVVVVCVVSYLLAGHRSIYPSQRLSRDKAGTQLDRERSLTDLARETNSGALWP